MTTPSATREIAPITYQNVGVASGQLCIPRGAGTVNVYNGDIFNELLLAADMNPQVSNSIHVQPLTNAKIDASRRAYYMSVVPFVGANVAKVTVSAAELSPSPAQIAAQINALGLAKETTQLAQTGTGLTIAQDVASNGVPLLSKSVRLHTAVGATIAGGGSTAVGSPYTITQIGYEIALSVQIPAAATIPGIDVTLAWTDSVTGQIVDQQHWVLGVSNAAPQQYVGTGPTVSDTLTLTLRNLDPAQIITFSMTFAQNSRIYARHDWRQLTVNAVPGFSNASYDQAGNTIINTAPNIGAGTSQTRLIALYAGGVTFNYIGGGIGSFCEINYLIQGGLTTAFLFSTPVTTVAGQISTFKIDLPRASCVAVLFNGGAAAAVNDLIGTISEQAV